MIDHIAQLIPDPRNARRHTPRNVGMIADALQEVGAARSIVIDEDNVILAGNATIEAAAQAGIERVRVIEADGNEIIAVRRSGLNKKQKKRLALYDNRAAELAEWEPEVLSEDRDFLDGLFTTQELDDLLAGLAADPVEDPCAQIDRAAELQEKWQTERNQLWSIGRHRLLCGDSTSADDVGRLMGGEKAQAVICDPPYAVRDDNWDTFKDDQQFAAFTGSWLWQAYSIANVVVCFFADKNVPLLLEVAARLNVPYRRALIWRKPPGSQFAGASLDGFWFDFEIIQVFGVPQFKADKSTRMAVLEHRTVTGQEHGCEKPTELLCDLVTGYAQKGGVVVDLFNATGTTMVAAEQTGRTCYGLELEPKYCAVTLERMSGLGLEPRLVSGT